MDPLHHREERAVVGAEVVDADDVAVAQRGRDARLIDEHPYRVFVASELGKDALDDEVFGEAFRAQGLGSPDLGHAADSDAL